MVRVMFNLTIHFCDGFWQLFVSNNKCPNYNMFLHMKVSISVAQSKQCTLYRIVPYGPSGHAYQVGHMIVSGGSDIYLIDPEPIMLHLDCL